MYKLAPSFTSPTGFTMEPSGVIRTTDDTFIPFDPDNRDYQRYLRWMADGNVPSPAEPLPGESNGPN